MCWLSERVVLHKPQECLMGAGGHDFTTLSHIRDSWHVATCSPSHILNLMPRRDAGIVMSVCMRAFNVD